MISVVGSSVLSVGFGVVDEQAHLFPWVQIVDEQSEFVAPCERPDMRCGSIFVGALTNKFDRSRLVSSELERSHTGGYDGSHYGCTFDRGREFETAITRGDSQ